MAVLTDELYGNPNSRAALSLLAYCHYTNQDFSSALQCYEQLIALYPEQRSYLLNYAKCLFQTGDYEKALKTAVRYAEKFSTTTGGEGSSSEDTAADSSKRSTKSREADHYDEFAAAELIKLQAAIKYAGEEEPIISGKALLEQMPEGNVDKEANLGCLLYKEKRYEEAIEKFSSCLQVEALNLANRGGGGGGGQTGIRGTTNIQLERTGGTSSASNNSASTNSQLRRSSGRSTTSSSIHSTTSATITTGASPNRKPDLLYNLAVCYYQLKRYSEAAAYIGEIIEQGIQEHPELAVGANTEGGIEVRSVGNTEILHESALVEAFNLRAAIEYQLKNLDAAREALTDMPPRAEEELDAVTLHNAALLSMDSNPVEGFEKLQFLIGNQDEQQAAALGPPNFPPETFANLLLLYCKHDYFELAADLMAENATYTYRYLSPYLYEFLDALITQQTSPEEAYQRFDELAARHTDSLRRQAKQIAEAKAKLALVAEGGGGGGASGGEVPHSTSQDSGKASSNSSTSNSTSNSSLTQASRQRETLKRLTAAHEETLSLYIPVLMAQAKIYWELEAFANVEKVFRKSAEFCNDLDLWKLNVAHVLFMQVQESRTQPN